MPHKCSVVKCRAGYSNGPVRPMFSFPSSSDLRQRWINLLTVKVFLLLLLQEFVSITSNLCTFYVIYAKLDSISMNPIPTIN